MKKIVGISFLVFALVLVRVFETTLFYDPFIDFFHQSDYLVKDLPELNWIKYLGSLIFRYGLNTLITIGLVEVIFEKRELTRFAFMLLSILFILLSAVLIVLILARQPEKYQFLFYVRRILIHPVMTLLLIPALWYNEKFQKSEN